jgi:DNA polymerase-3 subunit delta'
LSWDNVIDQQRVKDVLRTGLRQGRVSHAYLFYGPYGAGKRAAALEFAKALQCTNGGSDEGCGDCPNCSRIDRMIHPDVRFFLPITKDTTDANVAERIQELSANPYATVDFVRKPRSTAERNKQVIYPVALIREPKKNEWIFKSDIKRIIDYKSFEGSFKVVVLIAADHLETSTANAFLKMLEEPTEDTVFVLVTDRPDRLLPTILSRCQPVRFDPIPVEAIEHALVQREQLSRESAAPLARLADGSYSVALDLIKDELSRSFREYVLTFLRSVYMNDTLAVVGQVDRLAALSIEEVKLFLRLLLGWIRDLVLVRELGAEAHIVNVDARDSLERFCSGLTEARLDQMVDLVEEAIALISRNVRVALVLTALAGALRSSMKGNRTLPLMTPLADQLVAQDQTV